MENKIFNANEQWGKEPYIKHLVKVANNPYIQERKELIPGDWVATCVEKNGVSEPVFLSLVTENNNKIHLNSFIAGKFDPAEFPSDLSGYSQANKALMQKWKDMVGAAVKGQENGWKATEVWLPVGFNPKTSQWQIDSIIKDIRPEFKNEGKMMAAYQSWLGKKSKLAKTPLAEKEFLDLPGAVLKMLFLESLLSLSPDLSQTVAQQSSSFLAR